MQNPQIAGTVSPSSVPRVVSKLVGDCDQLSEVVRNGNAQIVQLGRGRFDSLMARLDLGPLTLLRALCPNHTLCHGWGDTRHTYSVIPMSWQGELKWSGRLLERPSLFHWDTQVEYFRVGTNVETVALIFDRETFGSQLSHWTGGLSTVLNDRCAGGSAPVPVPPVLIAYLRRVAERMHDEPGAFENPQLRKSVEQAIRQALYGTLWNAEPASASRRSLRNFQQIIRHVVDWLAVHETRPVYLVEMCAAAGVSARTLENAFKSVCDLTPMGYLRLRRLRHARRLLRDGTLGSTTVKAAAYSAGFLELGRFAVDYRRHFGESPGATLARGS
jgi:AraC-like DNA-binding protein